MSETPLTRLRAMCMAFPEVTEKLTWESTVTFRVRDKIFAMAHDESDPARRPEVTCKAPPGAQEILIDANPERFFRPAYVGPKGWIGIRLDGEVAWDEVAGLVADSYRMTAPRKLLAAMG